MYNGIRAEVLHYATNTFPNILREVMMCKLRKRFFILVLLLAVIALAACARMGTSEQAVEATQPPPATAT